MGAATPYCGLFEIDRRSRTVRAPRIVFYQYVNPALSVSVVVPEYKQTEQPPPEVSVIQEALTGLRAVVAAIGTGGLRIPEPDFEHLLTQANRAQGRPADVEGWAQHLAADVSEISD